MLMYGKWERDQVPESSYETHVTNQNESNTTATYQLK